MGIFLLNEFIARKTLHASDIGITIMLMVPMISFLIPLFWKPQYQKGRIFLWLGVPARLVLLVILFATGAHLFICLIIISSLVANVLIPVQNNIIKLNYGKLKGYYFGRATTISALATVSTALLFGWLLTRDESSYRIVYPVAGLVGMVSFITWSKIRKRSKPSTVFAGNNHETGWNWSDVKKVLRRDKYFRYFLINFFIYGVGFMMLHLVVPLYLVDRMNINYSQAAIARGLIFYTILVFIAPLAGRVYDKIGPYRISGIGFSVLGISSILILFAEDFFLIYTAFAVFAVAMSCINMVWNLGPVHIAPTGSERLYMSIHMSLVGLRACFAYPLGILIKTVSSYETVFVIVIILEIVAAAGMFLLGRKAPSQETP